MVKTLPTKIFYNRRLGSQLKTIFNLDSIGHSWGLLLTFTLGFVVRLIPEVLSWPYPIGFDTIYYGARIKNGVIWCHWSEFFSSTWLLYGILIPVNNLIRGDPFILLKFTAPLLYSLNACGIYYFARKALSWSVKKAFLAAFFFVFQLASLRISWDLHRNMLALGLLLFTLTFIKDFKNKWSVFCFVPLSVLVVWGHELASVVLFVIVSGLVLEHLRRDKHSDTYRVVVAVAPAFILFLIGIYLRVFPIEYHVETNVIDVHDRVLASLGGLFFLVDYLHIVSSYQHYPTYLDLFSNILSLFGLLYLLSLPLILIGFFRNCVLDFWTLFLLIGSFNALVTPFCALNWWDRWMCMLVYPFTFYAVNGILRVFSSKESSVKCSPHFLGWLRLSKVSVSMILSFIVLLGSIFMSVRYNNGGFLYTPYTIAYLPSTMLHNTVLLQDVDDTLKAIGWLDEHMDNSSVILAQHALLGWALSYLGKRVPIIYYVRDMDAALNLSLYLGFDRIYLVWWSRNNEWYGLEIPKGFVSIRDFGRVSVFEYTSEEEEIIYGE